MTSALNSVTSITYVAMTFWPVNASMSYLKGGEGQRGHVDLRASPQVIMVPNNKTISLQPGFEPLTSWMSS